MFKNLLQPIFVIKLKYLPLLTVYFANSLAAFSQIAEMFWLKDSLELTSSQIISITIWANLPWSLKILFGQLLDSVKIIGSQRKIYIYIAAFLMLIGNLITIGVANQLPSIVALASIYQLLIVAGLFIQIGFVLQDLVADTLCYDVVDKCKQPKKEIANIQILARIVDISGAIIAVLISGIIAAKFSYANISYVIPCIALISITGSLIIKGEPKVTQDKINLPIFIVGLAYLLTAVIIVAIDFPYAQEMIFIVGITIISIALYRLCIHLNRQKKKEIFSILLVIFACRAVPTHSPGVKWWQIDELGFTPEFYGNLSQASTILGLIGVWILAKRVINRDVGLILLFLNTLHIIFQLPMIGIAFGLDQWTIQHFGFGAKTIALIDNIMEGPFLKLKFLILCIVATYYAPKNNVATWFALVMSVMSLAYVSAARILKRIIADIYVIERGYYENIPELLIVNSMIGFFMPSIVILLFMNPFKKIIKQQKSMN